ncbi:MAG: hypothetical protein J5802_09530 [Butyrivibrio sp.]|nr:hypothetical protein [Butyrivibrio sp.]
MTQNGISFDTVNNIDTLFYMFDEAIDDMENGRVISEEEMWDRLAKVCSK